MTGVNHNSRPIVTGLALLIGRGGPAGFLTSETHNYD